LSVADGTEAILVKCHTGDGCPLEDICRAVGKTPADLFHEPKKRGGDDIVATYDYVDEVGRVLSQTVRTTGKGFWQRRPAPGGGWQKGLGDTRRVLYRLPNVIVGVEEKQTIYVVEGEKDVHSVERAGGVATCNAMGAGKWRAEFSEF